MKPKFKHAIKTSHGVDRKEDLVYCEYNQGELIIAKHLPKRPLYETNRNFGFICSHLRQLYSTISAEYKQDLATYTLMYRSVSYDSQKIPISAYSIFTKMMWSLKKKFPEIDLSTITREEILAQGYPVRNIQESMKAGLILEIEEAGLLVHEM
jgi:hypothetical protein